MPSTAKATGKDDIKTFIKVAKTKDTQQILEVLNIRNERTHRRAQAVLNGLMAAYDDTSDPALRVLIDLLADAVDRYEEERYPISAPSPIEMLKFLMTQHNLKQTDLTEEIGGQGIVSQILNGKRELNKRQIEALSKRFGVSPAVFFSVA